MNYKDYFKDKRITVMGLGLLGRGVGDVKFLAECGVKLTVTDLKTEEELKPSLEQLKTYDISYTLGDHKIEDFKDCDMVLKAAGVPLDSPFIAEAKKNKIPVRMSTALFAEFSPATIVGVTGTRGKSTVAAMIFESLKKAGKKVFLGGNIRGLSTLSHLPESSPQEIAVLELDSWQLQGFGEAKISPHISVFTNLKQDHLNYYPNEETYFDDKANIFKFQKSRDLLIAGQHVINAWINKFNFLGQLIVPKPIPEEWKLKVIGEYNRENASFAAEASRKLGMTEEEIKAGLEFFEPVEGRLQFVREVDGVKIYNDNNATTPDATINALASLSEFKEKIVLIIGGADKGLDLQELLEALPRFCKSVVTIPGTGTEKLLAVSCQLKAVKVHEVANLQEAVQKAIQLAESKDTILFSPAFASFGPPPGGFKNEYDRNDQFLKLIKAF